MNSGDGKKNRAETEPKSYLLYDFVKITAGIPGILFFRPKVVCFGKEKKIRGGAVLIANHAGYFDPVYVMFGAWNRRIHFVCLKEFFERPFTAWLFRQFHCIPVDRERPGILTVRRAAELLREGKLVSLFPEGHIVREKTGLQEFRSGAVLMAALGGTPVIPMYIAKRENAFSRLRIGIGDPVTVTGPEGKRPSSREIERLTELLQKKEEELKLLMEQEETENAD